MKYGSMNVKAIIIVLNIFVFSIALKAQTLPSPFIIKKYTSYDGLPHNYVLNLRQDDHGYLWVGTAYGLCRFDGENFFPVNIKDGNKNIIVTAGNQLPDSKIWIWTKSDEEFLYDGKKLFQVPDSLQKKIHSTDGFEGTIYWTNRVKFFGKLETTNGWYYNYKNEIIFLGKQGDSTKIDQTKVSSDFMHIMGFADKQLYFYTDRGLYAWDNKNLRPLFQKQILGKPIYSCYRDSKKRFWIGTRNEGVYISKPGEENVMDYHISLANNLIAGFFEDKEGNMWIAGYEGLIKVQDLQYEILSKNDYPFLWDVNLVSKGKNEDLFIFSETYGLIRETRGKFIYSENNLFKEQLVDALCYDKKGRVWCVSRQNRLLLYDGKEYFDLTDKMKPKSNENYIDITFDEFRNKIWITSDRLSVGDEYGFSIFNSSDNRIIKKPNHIIAIPGGKIIVATDANELLLIDSANHIKNLNTLGLFVPENIQNFYKDATGYLFISSIEAGLIQCQLMKNDSLVIINRFNTGNGLKNNFVNSVSFDKQNRMWVSTMGGIAVIDYKRNNNAETQLVYYFGLTDGLPEFTGYGHLACDAEGNMWYTTLYSVSKFPVNKTQFYHDPPVVSIEDITLNMKETDWSKYSDSLTTFHLPVNPVMKYYENTITISFKAATMKNAENVQYSYLLSGINNYWSNGSKSNTITFAKLKPGNYTFFVRAKTSSMNWGNPALFSFTIRKPYWQQLWFIALLILICACTIYGIYRIRISQLKKEKQIRDQIASDLHDDLGSTLNSVKVYATIAALEKDNKQYLEKIQETIQDAITGVRDIIWVLDEKKDSFEHLVTRINHFASPLCVVNQVSFIVDIEDSIRSHVLHREEKRNLYMIMKEAINNSIKYAGCETIELKVAAEGKKLQFTIGDDGKGFEKEKIKEGNGLKNITSRAKKIGYTCSIISATGTGTIIVLGKS